MNAVHQEPAMQILEPAGDLLVPWFKCDTQFLPQVFADLGFAVFLGLR